MKSKKNYLTEMVMTAVLTAILIILERFMSYKVWNSTIGFSFIAVSFAASMFGAPSAMIVAGLGDFIGAVLFPIGQYFPGFTFTAIITALCTALFIHKNAKLWKIIVSVLINQIFGSLILNSLWISILYGAEFWTLIPARLVQCAIMTVVQIVLITLFFGENSKIRVLLKKQITK